MSSRSEFVTAIRSNAGLFGVELSSETIEQLADHFELIVEHDPVLHLVAPCPPEEMATRHFLESLTMLKHLPPGTRFADVGSGGGFPAIPCLIARKDLVSVVIESKAKKAGFLSLVADRCGLRDRVEIVPKQFAEHRRPDVSYISCRALDGFLDKLPRLLKWAGPAKPLFFGGNSLREALEKNKVAFSEELMPLSDQRFLFYGR